MKNLVRVAAAILVATGAIVAPGGTANAAPAQSDPLCPLHQVSGTKKFKAGAKLHSGPYGSFPVVFVLPRAENLGYQGWCVNSYGNRWWDLGRSEWVWDGYAA